MLVVGGFAAFFGIGAFGKSGCSLKGFPPRAPFKCSIERAWGF